MEIIARQLREFGLTPASRSHVVAAAAEPRGMDGLALANQLFEVRPADPLTFVGVAMLLAAVAFAASYVPARRAMRVDPIVALRHE